MRIAAQLQVSYPECETQSAAAVVAVAVAGKLGSGQEFCTDDHATTSSVPVHTNRDRKVNSLTSSHKTQSRSDPHTPYW
jgi:hypothetical protein